jgi:hypothetical protein
MHDLYRYHEHCATRTCSPLMNLLALTICRRACGRKTMRG